MTNLADLREKLERARDVVRRATRGPWDFNHDFQWGSSSIHSATETRPVVADVLRSMDGQAHNDAEAAVAAVNFVREALPNLLDLLDAKEARERELVDALRPFAESAHVHKNEPGCGKILVPCTVADLRAARLALSAGGGA